MEAAAAVPPAGGAEEMSVEPSTSSGVREPVEPSTSLANQPRRRCFDEAFPSGSESDSLTPDAEECPEHEHGLYSMYSGAGAGARSFVCEAHPGCLKTFGSVRELEEHYNRRHRHRCSVCRKSLPSDHILELHVLEAHDTLFALMAERKPMLSCFMESCKATFWKPENRQEHCLSEHKFPKSFKLWDLRSSLGKGKKSGKENAKGCCSRTAPKEKARMDASNEMQVELSGGGVNDAMDLDPAPPTAKPRSTKGKAAAHECKSVPVQISFGQSASRAFKPKYSFGLGGDRNCSRDRDAPGPSTSSKMEMDLSDIRDVLPRSSASATSSAASNTSGDSAIGLE